MSQFDHESEDQSEALNRYIRDQRGMQNDPQSGATIMAQHQHEREYQERRDAYRRPGSKEHLQEELYRAVAAAIKHLRAYLQTTPVEPPLTPQERRYGYYCDPAEVATRQIHAMIFQEMDLYLEERDRAILRSVRYAEVVERGGANTCGRCGWVLTATASGCHETAPGSGVVVCVSPEQR